MANTQNAALKRIHSLLDEGSFVEIGAYVTGRSAANDPTEDKNGDGVITGYGTIDSCLVYVYAQDAAYMGGSVGEMHAKKISKIYDMAMNMGAPVVALVDCAGVRLTEGNDSLYSFGQMFAHQAKASGVIPQITAVFGTCGGGMSVSASMSDFVFMESSNGKLFLNSPNAVEGNYEEKCDTASAKYQSEVTGLCDFAGTEDEIFAGIRELLSVLPENNERYNASYSDCDDDLNRAVDGIEAVKDKADMVRAIADNGIFVEVKKTHAVSMTTGFIRLNGQTIGVVANNDRLIDHFGAKKAIKFVNFCDAFNIPVLTLTDVDGFAHDENNEINLARALGKLTYTYAKSNVPKVTVITGHAYGTAGVVMNTKAVGSDIVYAWTNAEMGFMDKELLKKISDDTADGNVNAALYNARRGYVDDIIVPNETRQRVIAAFEMLYTKTDAEIFRKHGTI